MDRKTLLTLFITFLLASCAPKVEKEYYPNGNVKYQWEVKDGVRNGITRSYFENGDQETEGRYMDDKPVGWHILYYPGGQVHQRTYYQSVNGVERRARQMLYDKKGRLTADFRFAEKSITSELLQTGTIHVNDTVVIKLTIKDPKHALCAADLGKYDENLNEKDGPNKDFLAHRGNKNHEVLMGIQLTKPGLDTLTWMVFDYDLRYDSASVETQVGEQSYARLIVNVEPR
jgi:hypothetical protein